MKFLTWLAGDQNKREQRRLAPLVQKINSLEPEFESLSDVELQHKTVLLRERFATKLEQRRADLDDELSREPDEVRRQKIEQQAEQRILQELLPEAFATVREAAKRVHGMRHYDVQLIGGMVLHDGKIAEMRTGEGKTLVATLPTYLNALAGHGVHVITVNDYLAKRDAHWMGKVYDFLGLTVAAIGHDQSWQYTSELRTVNSKPEDKETVGSPLTVDRLPDQDWPNFKPISRREAYHCDITYGTNNEFGFDYLRDNMAQHPSQLVQRELWYAVVDEVDSILIDEARTPLIISAPAEESGSLYQSFAQVAKRLKKDADYTVDEKFRTVTMSDDGIRHVEEWVGLPNLYAPENVRLVHHLEEALKAQALFTKNKDYVVREGEVVIVDEFTGRLMPGRRYSEGLHQAIEAKEGVEVRRESDTLATISFQNLFRLYAKLAGMTGTASTEAEEFWKIYQIEVIEIPTHRPSMRIDRQDLIYKTEAGKYSALAQEIKQRHEKGQPMLIGTASIKKNEQLSKVLRAAGIAHEILNAKQHEREAKIIANAGKVGAVTLATNMAGRGVDIILGGEPPKESKQQTLNNEQKEGNKDWEAWQAEHQKVLELGGLYVIGTERHEARRIDNQLRGRAGRQGDPGETQFYLSMEDDLMRIFGGERLKTLMDRMGVPDDQPIQAKMISGSIEAAQRRVEGHNFDIRKHLVEYDDVMNKHREYIYRLRRRILLGDQFSSPNSQVPNNDQLSNDQNTKYEIQDTSHLHNRALSLMDDAQKQTYEAKVAKWGPELTAQVERAIWLRTIDTMWVEHLNAIEALRTGIGLRGYGQHDPLVAYRQEAFHLFERLKNGIEQEVANLLINLELQQRTQVTQPETERRALRLQGADDTQTAGFQADTGTSAGQSSVGERMGSEVEKSHAHGEQDASPKIGRNDLCPCGSGKKYKKCHGQ